MKTIDKSKLTKDSKGHLCAIINTYGAGDHPWADDRSISFFAEDYADKCLKIAWNENEDDGRREIINTIRDELGI